jgi:hypothetical protein
MRTKGSYINELPAIIKIMSSFIWNREFQDAYDEPYEYPAQEQFHREAETIISKLKDSLSKFNGAFSRDDNSKNKAVWMLVTDAVDALIDCLEALKNKKHRISSRMYRDVIETLDLACYFMTNTKESNTNLIKWYSDEVIPNRVFRDYLKKTVGEEKALEKASYYSTLSKFTHRTYFTLIKSYVLRADNTIGYDNFQVSDTLVLPHTIAIYYVYVAELIKTFLNQLSAVELISQEEIKKIWEDSMETYSEPRRFKSARQVFIEHQKANKDNE